VTFYRALDVLFLEWRWLVFLKPVSQIVVMGLKECGVIKDSGGAGNEDRCLFIDLLKVADMLSGFDKGCV
jgi:hypothetical protein